MRDGKLAWPLTRIWIAPRRPRQIKLTKEIFYVPALRLTTALHMFWFDFFFDAALMCLDQKRWKMTEACIAYSYWDIPGGDRYFNSSTAREMRYKQT
jgi:hypothetical protein